MSPVSNAHVFSVAGQDASSSIIDHVMDAVATGEDSLDPAIRLKPRERILGTARGLFRKHGIRGIGVDAIAEAAGTNKITLYRNFGSKDDLVIEGLGKGSADAEVLWSDLETEFPGDPKAQLLGWVRRGAARLAADGRGCDLVNAAVELADVDHPARRVIEEVKTAHRDRWRGSAGQRGSLNRTCSPIRCRSCSKARGSAARASEPRGEPRNSCG